MIDPSIFITKWGTSGPRVVMIHGSAQGSEIGGDVHFRDQKVLAERGWQVIAPDRPGHGRSPAPGRPDDAEEDGKWVAELLGDGSHLVGHSFGGCVALAAAAMRPSAVHSLTLIEPAMKNLSMDEPVVQEFVRIQREILTGSGPPDEIADRFAKHGGIPPSVRGQSTPEQRKSRGKGLSALKLPTEEMLRDWLATIAKQKVPLFVVSGGWSPAFDVNAIKVAELGGGRHAIHRSEDHFPNRAPNNGFNEALVEFMTAADKAAGR